MRKCLICNAEYELGSKRHPNQKYCSTQCNANASHRRRKGLPLKLEILTCEVCDKKFGQTRSNNYSYCSKSCKKLGVFRKFKGLPVKGPRKHIWGTGHINQHGYRVVSRNHPNARQRTKNGKGQILEHTYVMSQYLGRPLKNTESVHHKNGIRHDNRIENLELWCKTIKNHRWGQRVEDVINWAKEFLTEYGYDVIQKKDTTKEPNGSGE